MPRKRAVIAALIAILLLVIGLALALSGVTVPAGKDDAVPIESTEAGGAAGQPDVEPFDEAPAIPAAYRGEWNRDLAACGTGSDETRLRIGPDRARFYESEGRVVSVRSHGPRTIDVTLELTGEGERWREIRRLELSPDGDALTIGDLVRRRCR